MTASTEFLRRTDKAGVVRSLVDWPVFKQLLDGVVVVPVEPPTHTRGGLERAKQTVLAERAMTMVGRVHAIGALAFTAKTRDGVHFADDPNLPQVGDWVLYTKSAGQVVPIRDAQSRDPALAPRLVVLKDNDIQWVFASEAEAKKVLGWVE